MEFIINENFEFEPFEENGVLFLEKTYKEASSGLNFKNIVGKIWGFIRKIIDYMKRALQRFWNWIRRKKNKFPDEILDEMELEKNDKVDVKNTTTTIRYRSSLKSDTENAMHVEDILMYIDKKKEQNGEITFYWKDKYEGIFQFFRNMKHDDFDENIIDNAKKLGSIPYPPVMFFKDIHSMSILIKVIKDYFTTRDATAFERGIEDYSSSYNDPKNYQKDFSTKLINEVIIPGLSEISDLMNREDYINAQGIESEKLKEISRYLSANQIRINFFTSKFYKMDIQIDKSYYSTIDDPKTLGRFVNGMLGIGLAPKYIAMNAYLVSTPNLKGKGNANSPIFGQSRAVLFPSNGHDVIKVALSNAFGRIANKQEYDISYKMTNAGLGKYIAETKEQYSDFAVIVAEYIEGKSSGIFKAQQIGNEINQEIANRGLNFRIADTHYQNVLKTKDGRYVIIDYGMAD